MNERTPQQKRIDKVHAKALIYAREYVDRGLVKDIRPGLGGLTKTQKKTMASGGV